MFTWAHSFKMTLENKIYRINKLHQLIAARNTGTPDEFASSMQLSRRHLYNLLDELRSMGAHISYSRANHTFYYENAFHIEVTIKITKD